MDINNIKVKFSKLIEKEITDKLNEHNIEIGEVLTDSSLQYIKSKNLIEDKCDFTYISNYTDEQIANEIFNKFLNRLMQYKNNKINPLITLNISKEYDNLIEIYCKNGDYKFCKDFPIFLTIYHDYNTEITSFRFKFNFIITKIEIKRKMIGINEFFYEKLKIYCENKNIPISKFVTDVLSKIINE